MTHTTTWEPKGIKWQFHGIVTSEEVDEANRELHEDSRFDSINYFLWDMSNVDKLIISDLEINKPTATDLGASYFNNNIRGTLVANEGHVYDICNSYIDLSKKLNTTLELKLFNDNDSALQWLLSIQDV